MIGSGTFHCSWSSGDITCFIHLRDDQQNCYLLSLSMMGRTCQPARPTILSQVRKSSGDWGSPQVLALGDSSSAAFPSRHAVSLGESGPDDGRCNDRSSPHGTRRGRHSGHPFSLIRGLGIADGRQHRRHPDTSCTVSVHFWYERDSKNLAKSVKSNV